MYCASRGCQYKCDRRFVYALNEFKKKHTNNEFIQGLMPTCSNGDHFYNKLRKHIILMGKLKDFDPYWKYYEPKPHIPANIIKFHLFWNNYHPYIVCEYSDGYIDDKFFEVHFYPYKSHPVVGCVVSESDNIPIFKYPDGCGYYIWIDTKRCPLITL